MTAPDAYFRVSWDCDGVRAVGDSPYRAGETPAGGGLATDPCLAAGWAWDGQTLTIQSDRYGMVPLFLWETTQALTVAASPLTLLWLGAPVEIDDAAMAAFLRLGFFLGEDTPFRAIRVLPPDTTLVWRDGTVTTHRQPRRNVSTTLSRAAARDEYIERFRLAVAHRLPAPDTPFAVPLSGGRDSRHILFELCRQGRRPTMAVTADRPPPWNDEDVRVAARVADSLGVHHIVLSPTPLSLQFQAEIVKHRVQHFAADEGAWMLPMIQYLTGRVSSFFDGLGGDVLSAGLFLDREGLDGFAQGRLEELAERYCISWLPSETWMSFLTPDARRRWARDIARHRIASELARHADAPNPPGAFYFWNRTRREIALGPLTLLRPAGRALLPYLDPVVFDLLAALPGSHLLDHTFHSETIAYAFPQASKIPYEDKSAPPRDDQSRLRRLAWDLLRYAMGRRSAFVRCAAVVPRLARAVVDRRYSSEWIQPLRLLYLLQLEAEGIRERGTLPSAATSIPAAQRPKQYNSALLT